MPSTRARTRTETVVGLDDASLIDLVDNALNKGVVLTGEVTLGLAQVDLVYARLSVLLCAADRVLRSFDEPRRIGRRGRDGSRGVRD